MPRERRRFQRILEYQSHVEEEDKRRLQMLQARLNRARQRLKPLREACRALRPKRAVGNMEKGATLVRTQAYAERLRRDLAGQENAVRRAELELSRAREQLTTSVQRRIATERMLRREAEANQERLAAREQEDLDDRGRLEGPGPPHGRHRPRLLGPLAGRSEDRPLHPEGEVD